MNHGDTEARRRARQGGSRQECLLHSLECEVGQRFLSVPLSTSSVSPCLRGESLFFELPKRQPAVLGFLEDAFGILRRVFGRFGGAFSGAFGAEATGSEGVERPFDADLVLADLAEEIIHSRSGGHLCLARRASKGRVPET